MAVNSSFTSLMVAAVTAVVTNAVVAICVVFVPAEAVGAAGVPVNVGESDNTAFTVPVEVVTPVPPLATGNVPATPEVNGNPVRFVATPEAGVPSAGVVSVGLVKVLFVKVSVPPKVAKVPVVGSVTDVVAVEVNVVANAPDVVRLPPNVIVFPVLATPVPPLAPGNVPLYAVAVVEGVDQPRVPLPVVDKTCPLAPWALG